MADDCIPNCQSAPTFHQTVEGLTPVSGDLSSRKEFGVGNRRLSGIRRIWLWYFWDEANRRKAIGFNPRRTGYRAVAWPSTVLIGITPRFKKSPVDLTEITQNHSPFKDGSPVKNQAIDNGLILLLVNKSSCTITRYPAPSMRLPPPHVIPPSHNASIQVRTVQLPLTPPINTRDPSFHPSIQSYLRLSYNTGPLLLSSS